MEAVEEEVEISLEEIFGIIKRNWKMIMMFTVFTAVMGFIVNQFVLSPEYTASSRVYIMNTTPGSAYTATGEIAINASDLSSSLMLSKDYVEILKSDRVTKAAAQRMGVLDLSEYDISVSTASDTRMIRIVVKGAEQKGVAKLANILTEEFTACVQQIMHMDNITVIDAATVPAQPSGPAKARNTLLAGMVGCLAAVAIVFLRYFMDTTIKNSEDVQKYLELPVLAKIPDFSE